MSEHLCFVLAFLPLESLQIPTDFNESSVGR